MHHLESCYCDFNLKYWVQGMEVKNIHDVTGFLVLLALLSREGLLACPMRLLCPPPLAALSPWQPSRRVMQQQWMCTVLFAEVWWHALYQSKKMPSGLLLCPLVKRVQLSVYFFRAWLETDCPCCHLLEPVGTAALVTSHGAPAVPASKKAGE